jgi:glycosyltransferase involved in cell wall biosynthesis
MRVLHVVESTIAGVRTHVQALATGLRRYGVQPVVACPLHRQDSFGDDQFVSYLTSVGVPVIPVAMRRSISPKADGVALRQLIGLLRHERFDLIHLHSSKAGFLGRLAARAAGVAPVVYSPHGLFFLGDHSPQKRLFYLSLERMASRLCDRIVAVSPSERDTIIASGIAPARKVICIEQGVEVMAVPTSFDREAARSTLALPPDAFVVGTIARATPQKNPFLFVEAAAQTLALAPQAYMLWCGDGELRAAAEARAHALGIAARCRFLGHREDAQSLLAAFDLFWLTSNYESFGLATAEAMALERPVIATDVVGTCDVVVSGVTGLLVPPCDPSALARATIELLSDPERARAFGQVGRARVLERYTVDRMLDAIASLYSTLLTPGHPEATRRHATS